METESSTTPKWNKNDNNDDKDKHINDDKHDANHDTPADRADNYRK